MTQENLSLNDYYSTPDLALAAAISLWYPVETIDRTNPAKAQFFFKRDENLNQLIETFWKQKLRVEPQAYFNQLKNIKSRLYSDVNSKREEVYRDGDVVGNFSNKARQDGMAGEGEENSPVETQA